MPRVAVIGAGPAGVFATAELLKRPDVFVDVFDRLPTPFGLVRYGVAPDHFKIKSVAKILTKTLADPRVTFHGNIDYGTDLFLDDLREAYDAVLFATGAPLSRKLGVPGEDLPGNYAAADLVSWYNGHPIAGRAFANPTASVAVVGAGNVSLDVARVLLKSGPGLDETDVPQDVLAALGRSQVSEVHIIVRRGVADVKFSPAELLEIGKIENLDVVVKKSDLHLGEADQDRYDTDRTVSQRIDIFRDWAGQHRATATKRLMFHFRRSPVEITGSGHVEALRLKVNAPGGPLVTEDLQVQAVVCSIGYRGEPLDEIAFDSAQGLVPNTSGRVAPGVYVAGWIKRGPSGIIGTNKACAIESVRQLFAELDEARSPQPESSQANVTSLLRGRGCRLVDWAGWTSIDAAEITEGQEQGRARAKITDHQRLLAIGTVTPEPLNRRHL